MRTFRGGSKGQAGLIIDGERGTQAERASVSGLFCLRTHRLFGHMLCDIHVSCHKIQEPSGMEDLVLQTNQSSSGLLEHLKLTFLPGPCAFRAGLPMAGADPLRSEVTGTEPLVAQTSPARRNLLFPPGGNSPMMLP